jgi:cytochrome c oxidase assembly factor CtaG
LAIAVCPPIWSLAAHSLLTAHLIQVTLIMGFAPPLLLLGRPQDARCQLPHWTRRAGRVITQPVVAIVVVNTVFFAWHATVPFNASLRSQGLYALQMATLLLVSLAFWWPIVASGSANRKPISPFQKLGYILFATIPQTFAGMTVALASHPLYSAYTGVPREFGLSLMSDQQIAGACMALVSKIALFAAFTVVLVRMLGEEADDADASDDNGRDGGGGEPDTPTPLGSLTPSPGWFALVETEDTARSHERVPAGAGKP